MGWADVFVEKAEGCRAAAGTLESPASPWAGSAIPGGQSQDCLPPVAGAGKSLTREQFSTMLLGNSLLLHSQAYHSPFSLNGFCQLPH